MRLEWLSRGIPLWITDKRSSYEERDVREQGDRRAVPGSQQSMEDTQATTKRKSSKKSPKKSMDVPPEPAPKTAETLVPEEQSAEAATTDVDEQPAQTPAKKKLGDSQEAPKKKRRRRGGSTADKVADEHADEHAGEHASDTPDDEEAAQSEEELKRMSPKKHTEPKRYGEIEAHVVPKRSTRSKPSGSAPKGATTLVIKLGSRLGGGGGMRKPPGGNE